MSGRRGSRTDTLKALSCPSVKNRDNKGIKESMYVKQMEKESYYFCIYSGNKSNQSISDKALGANIGWHYVYSLFFFCLTQ